MKTFFQFLKRNKLYTFIEIFGLSVAIGFIILLAAYAHTEYSVGAKQPLSKELYAVGAGDFIGMTVETIPTFAPSIPEITGYTRVTGDNDAKDAMVGDNYYQIRGFGVDTNFFEMFEYRHNVENPDRILYSKDEMILSESFARKAFGVESPIGKTIKIGDRNYVVSGTVEDFGSYDIYEYVDFLYSIKNTNLSPMDNFGPVATFITLAESADVEVVKDKLLDKYLNYWSFYQKDGSNGAFMYGSSLTRLDEIYFSPLDKYLPLRSGNSCQVWILLVVGLVLLISAVFNYVNLTVAQTGKRAKEMATRRLLGSSKSQIIGRYLSESAIFTFGCFALGFALALYCRPLLDRILQAQIAFPYDFESIGVLFAVLLIMSLVSGLMPALMVAKYKPVDVVKGNFSFHSKMRLGRVFITLQSIISVIMTTMALAMMLQIHFLTTMPAGYNTNLMQVRTRSLGNSSQQVLRERLAALPQVKRIAFCGQTPAFCGFNGVPLEDNKNVLLAMPTVDSVAFEMFGFKVLEQFSNLSNGKVWLTREAQRLFNADVNNPKIGTDDRYEVCGIIEDYKVRDAIFEQTNSYNSVRMIDESYDWIAIQLIEVNGDKGTALEAVRNECNKVTKELLGLPKQLEINYISDYLYDQLKGKRDTMLLVTVFMIMSVLISALGLLAMSVYYTEQQSRQIAIRKVYGSTTSEVTGRLSRNFMTLSIIAVVLSIPISIYLIRLYLQDFVNRIDFPVIAIVIASLISLAVSFISVYGRSHAAALRNPVYTLKKE